jgi:hypothetical protein
LAIILVGVTSRSNARRARGFVLAMTQPWHKRGNPLTRSQRRNNRRRINDALRLHGALSKTLISGQGVPRRMG